LAQNNRKRKYTQWWPNPIKRVGFNTLSSWEYILHILSLHLSLLKGAFAKISAIRMAKVMGRSLMRPTLSFS